MLVQRPSSPSSPQRLSAASSSLHVGSSAGLCRVLTRLGCSPPGGAQVTLFDIDSPAPSDSCFHETALGRSFSDDPIRMDLVWQDLVSFESVDTPSSSRGGRSLSRCPLRAAPPRGPRQHTSSICCSRVVVPIPLGRPRRSAVPSFCCSVVPLCRFLVVLPLVVDHVSV